MLREDPLRILPPQIPQADFAAQLAPHEDTVQASVAARRTKARFTSRSNSIVQVPAGRPELGQHFARRFLRRRRHGGGRQPGPEVRPDILQAPIPVHRELPLAHSENSSTAAANASSFGSSDAISACVSSTAACHAWPALASVAAQPRSARQCRAEAHAAARQRSHQQAT